MKNTVPVSSDLFEIDDDSLPNIKYHVFISKTTTKQLADYVKKEDWGKDNVLLYKYLDYIWRFQLIDKMVKKFKYKNQYRLVFHSGLYKRNNNEPLYMCLIPNKTHKTKNVPQKWRVAFGSGTGNESFVLKKDLLNTYKLNESDLPVKTVFVGTKKDSTFNPFYSFTINAEERIRTTKDRIMNTIKNDIGLREDISIKKLVKILNDAIKESLNEVRNNPSLVGKQVFIERNIINDKKVTNGYHLELLIPLTLNINNKNVYFAMVLRPNHKKRLYEGMSIITREMAYSNSRLIGEVKLQWLKPFINANKPDFNITNNIRNNINNINNPCNYNSEGGNNSFIYNINNYNIMNNNINNNKSIINVNSYTMYHKDISAAMNNYITFDDAMNYFLIGYDNLNYASPKSYNLTYNIH